MMGAEDEELAEIVGRAESEELVEHWKITLCRTGFEPAAHGRIMLAALGATDEVVQRAHQPSRRGIGAMSGLFGLDGIEVAPPSVAIARPLGMQRLHRGIGTPQRCAVDHQALTESVEEIAGGGAVEPFAHRPDVHGDDAPAERVIEGSKLERRLRRVDRHEQAPRFAWIAPLAIDATLPAITDGAHAQLAEMPREFQARVAHPKAASFKAFTVEADSRIPGHRRTVGGVGVAVGPRESSVD